MIGGGKPQSVVPVGPGAFAELSNFGMGYSSAKRTDVRYLAGQKNLR